MLDAAEESGRAQAGRHHHRAHQRQHGYRPGVDRCRARVPHADCDARQHEPRAAGADSSLWRGAGADRRGAGHEGAIARAQELHEQIAGSLIPDQFSNPANPAVHRRTTGPEIWEDTDGKVDIFVAGVGTGGTLTGRAEYLKAQNPAVRVVAVEPATSAVLEGGAPGPHGLQGIGAGFVPATLNTSAYDEVIPVTDEEAFAARRRWCGWTGCSRASPPARRCTRRRCWRVGRKTRAS